MLHILILWLRFVIFSSKVVGMLWSMLAQQQTWFGAQPWKSYGIQVIQVNDVG